MNNFFPTLIATVTASVFAANAASPVHDKVIEFVPAPGQFVNELPQWETGDNAESMAKKALTATTTGMISLGGYGGFVVVGFDHTIVNVDGKRDIYIEGNSFSGSSEPGIVLVAYDINRNGLPDDNEWFEIRGSEYDNSTHDYECTYYRPEGDDDDIRWTDNQGNTGYIYKNTYHSQPYWPQWLADRETLTFGSTRLPDNGEDQSGNGTYYVLSQYEYGYADNAPNMANGVWNEEAKIDIDWAVDARGNSVKMPGADFVKIYTGVNQSNGWLGENSTEVCRIIDAHVTREGSNPVLDESVSIDPAVLDAFLDTYPDGNTASVAETRVAGNDDLRLYLDRNTGCINFNAPCEGIARIFNQNGVLLYNAPFDKGANSINISGFPAGLYLVRIDGKTIKILKS